MNRSCRGAHRRAGWVALLLLAGCGGGGSGGGAGPAPAATLPPPASGPVAVAESALEATRVETTGAQLPVALAGLVLPLYPFHALGIAEGQRTETTAGDVTVTYRSSAGPRAVTFRRSEIVQSDAEGTVWQTSSNLALIETTSDTAEGWRLEYARLGTLLYEDQNRVVASMFSFGYETPLANIPASSAIGLGTARYDGRTTAIATDLATNASDLATGDVRLLVNFQSDRMIGVITNVVRETGSGNTPLGISFVVTNGVLRSRTDTVESPVDGALTAVNDATQSARSGTGSLFGRFFGPRADELVGSWSYSDNDLSILGLFYTWRDVAAVLDPQPVFGSDDGNAVASATGTSFLLRSTGPGEGLRRQAANGDITLTVAVKDAASQVDIPASLLAVTANSFQLAGPATGRWEEFASYDRPSDPLRYARHAHLSYSEGSSSLDRWYHFGYETPAASIPTVGSATYQGRTTGTARTGTLAEPVTGLLELGFQFDTGRLQGKLSAMQITDAGGNRRPFLDGLFQVTGDVGSVAIAAADGDHFRGTFGPGAVGNVGTIRGRFYGRDVDELAGTWSVTGQATTAEGSFGGRVVSQEHPAGDPRLPPWAGSADTDFTPEQTVIRAVAATAGSVPTLTAITSQPGTLTPRNDGGIRVEVDHQDGSFSARWDGETFGRNVGAALQPSVPDWLQVVLSADENGQTLFLGGEGYLSYARFGYWEDRTGGPLTTHRGVFYAGRETPAAEVPTQGSATYLGSTLGVGVSPFGLARLTGAVSMSVDFGSRAVSGQMTFGNEGAQYLVQSQAGTRTSFEFQDLQLSGAVTAGTNGFAGTLSARAIGNVSNTVGTGTFDGRFFGREAQEMAGKWDMSSPDGSVKAWGAFGATR